MANYIVTSSADDGSVGTLRAVLITANSNGMVDNISFNLAPGNRTITLNGTELSISESVTINGDLDDDGAPDITIDAAGNSRVLNIDDDDISFLDVTLEGLVVTRGRVNGDGGGIRSRENLTLNKTTVSGNSISGDHAAGGGIHSRYGSLALNNSTISGNFTSGNPNYGGGIYSYNSTLALNNSTVSGNYTSGSGSMGGGIHSRYGSLTLDNSTVSGNFTLNFLGSGGGIFSVDVTLTLNNSTVSGNYTSGANAGGGGIYSLGGSLTLRSSLITGNRASNANGDEVVTYSTVNVNANNLFGDDGITSAEAFINFSPGTNDLTATGDSANRTPLASILSPLADNGGPTLTHALPTGSPAIDAGSNLQSFATDQRGAGYLRELGFATDIGAFEVQVSEPVITTDLDQWIDENTTNVVNLESNDDVSSEGNGLAYTISGGNDETAFSVDQTTGALSFNAAPDFETPTDIGSNNIYQVQITVTDADTRSTDKIFSITVNDVNEAPSASDNTVVLEENSTYTFQAGDLGFSDPDAGDALAAIRISSLPARGEFRLDGLGVAPNDEIPVANLDMLVYTPVAGESGVDYASIGFELSDGELFSDPASLRFDVEAASIFQNGFEDNPVMALGAHAPAPASGVTDIMLTFALIGAVVYGLRWSVTRR